MLTTNNVCQFYGVTRQTVERWRKEGMPCKKYGKMIRFDSDAVEQWLNERR